MPLAVRDLRNCRDEPLSDICADLVGAAIRRGAARQRRTLAARVIASGGLASIVARETDVIERVEPHLVLYGLRADWLRARPST